MATPLISTRIMTNRPPNHQTRNCKLLDPPPSTPLSSQQIPDRCSFTPSRLRMSVGCAGCSCPPIRPLFACIGGFEQKAVASTNHLVKPGKAQNKFQALATEMVNITQARKDANKAQGFFSGLGAAIGIGIIIAVALGACTFGAGTAAVLAVGIVCGIGLFISGVYKQCNDPAGIVHLVCTPGEIIIQNTHPKPLAFSSRSPSLNHPDGDTPIIKNVLELMAATLAAYMVKTEICHQKKLNWPLNMVNGEAFISETQYNSLYQRYVDAALHAIPSGKPCPWTGELCVLMEINRLLLHDLGSPNPIAIHCRKIQTMTTCLMTAIRLPGIEYALGPVLQAATSIIFLPINPLILCIGFFASMIELSKSWITQHRIVATCHALLTSLDSIATQTAVLQLSPTDANRINQLLRTNISKTTAQSNPVTA